MLARQVGRHFSDHPEDFHFKALQPILEQGDLVMLNLENPVGVKGRPHHIQDPNVTFRCHTDTLQVLKRLKVVAVSLGNNHMLDYGEESLVETLEHLDAAGINHVGAGRNYEEANQPLIMEVDGERIAILSHALIFSASTKVAGANSPGVSDYRVKHILRRISALANEGCKVIVSLHWGMEYSFYPLPYQQEQARSMIDHGAAVVVGHGPHYPQGIERYRGGEIVYSLGNFIFDEPHRFANVSFIYGVDVLRSGGLANRMITPVQLVDHIPSLLLGEAGERMRRFIVKLEDVYKRKPPRFWRCINNLYFQDIIHRVLTMRSAKFLFLPPVSFYFSIGLLNIARKLSARNGLSILRAVWAWGARSLRAAVG